jgi:HK97 family phage major capsid protein/HK97 family phage prohead protease
MSFSSETPVKRWFGNEILDHNPKSVRTDFLNSGRAPLFMNHDTSSQPIGVIEKGSVEIGKDKIGRLDARFGKTATAQDALTNVDDKILNNTSVGYQVHEMRFDGDRNGEEDYRVTDWEPHEVSVVGVPADRTVGVDRKTTTTGTNRQAANPQERQMDENTTAAGDPAATTTATRSAVTDQARIEVTRHEERQVNAMAMEEQRVKTIQYFCQANNIDERIQRQFITSGQSIDKVGEDILAIVKKRGEQSGQSAADLGLTDQETKRFSLCKAILAVRDKDWSKAGFEADCSRTIAAKLGRNPDPNKIYVPLEVQRSQSISQNALMRHANSGMRGAMDNQFTRAATVGGAAGALVETINLSFIELLRNRTVAFRLGATVLSGLQGSVNIPRQTSAATASWLSTETTSISETDQGFGQLSLSPHTVGGYTEMSRLLLLQSSPDIEGIVNADLAAIIGIAVDSAVISGPGTSGAPKGILNTTGVGTGSIATTTLSTLTGIQGTVGAANVVPVRGGWAGNFTVSAGLRARNEFANTYSPIWYGSVWDGMMLGYPALASNQIPSGDLFFGDWAQIVVAEWGVLEVEVNPYANFQEGIIGVRAMMTVDVGVRYPAAFYVGTAFS